MYPEVDQTMRVSMELEDGINATLLADFRSSKYNTLKYFI